MLTNIIITSLVITGVHICFWNGMLLSWTTKYLRKLPLIIKKPLYECVVCMSSIYGTLSFIYFTNSFTWKVIPFIFAVAGLNTLINGLIGKADINNGEYFVDSKRKI